jgi:protein phosphatase
MKIVGLTDQGVVRAENQDTFIHDKLSDNTVFAAVLDGMGGAKAGRYASTFASETFARLMQEKAQAVIDHPATELHEILCEVNAIVYDKAIGHVEYDGMGTTFVGGVFTDNIGVIANIGDSRAYLIDEENCSAITHDHSIVAALVELGEITAEEARVHPQRNVITRAIGTDDGVEPDLYPIDLNGKTLLLCSDGLHGYFTEDELGDYIRRYTPEEACEKLVQEACARGGRDNITAIIMDARS